MAQKIQYNSPYIYTDILILYFNLNNITGKTVTEFSA